MLLLVVNLSFISLAQNDTEEVYSVVEYMPKFVGYNGESLQEFIRKESRISTSLSKTETSQNVFVQVIVEKDGTISFEKIASGNNSSLNEEAKRIVKSMPKWECGKLKNGQPVRVRFMFPIWFEIK